MESIVYLSTLVIQVLLTDRKDII